MERAIQDIKIALRGFRRNPGFSVAAVVMISLAIGTNAAIFSVVDAVVFRPLPFARPNELVVIGLGRARGLPGRGTASWPDFKDWRDQSRSFSGMSAYRSGSFVLTGFGSPELVRGIAATASLFELLGVPLGLGRGFARGEDEPGRNHVVVLSDTFWRRRFDANSRVVGEKISLDGESYTVIGVARPTFVFPPHDAESEFWVPAPYGEFDAGRANRSLRQLQVVGRLAPHSTHAQGQADLDTVQARLAEQYPAEESGRVLTLTPLGRDVVRDVRTAMLTLLAAVAFVLLIACANLANLLLARGTARRREFAVRAALGAGRARIVRQLLTENTALGVLGGALGLLVARWSLDALMIFIPHNLPRAHTIAIDVRVLAFTAVATVGSCIAFGALPAFLSSRSDVHEALKQSARTAAPARSRTRAALLIVEIAVAFVLLVGAGLALRSFGRLAEVDPGFNAQNLLTASITLPTTRYKDDAALRLFYRQLLPRLRSLPGAQSAGVAIPIPFSRWNVNHKFTIAGRPPPASNNSPTAAIRIVSPDYFPLMGIRLQRGRSFVAADDTDQATPVAIVNDTLARRYWPSEDPLGKQLTVAGQEPRTIVGVVADVKARLDAPNEPELYLPFAQEPAPVLVALVRSANPVSLIATLRAEVEALDPMLPLGEVKTMEERLGDSLDQRRLSALLLAAFAALALLLATVGIYALTSYMVAQRTHELGIRLALGASAGQVLRAIVVEALRLACLGLAVGIALALALRRAVATQLYGISPTDPTTFLALIAVVLVVAAISSLVPAWRATRVNPIIALRND